MQSQRMVPNLRSKDNSTSEQMGTGDRLDYHYIGTTQILPYEARLG